MKQKHNIRQLLDFARNDAPQWVLQDNDETCYFFKLTPFADLDFHAIYCNKFYNRNQQDFTSRPDFQGYIVEDHLIDAGYQVKSYFNIDSEATLTTGFIQQDLSQAVEKQVVQKILKNRSLFKDERLLLETKEWEKNVLKYDNEYRSKEAARECFLDGEAPEFTFTVNINKGEISPHFLVEYLKDRSKTITELAEKTISVRRLDIYKRILFHEAATKEYAALCNNTGSELHFDRAVRNSIGDQKTLNVTVSIKNVELTFKTEARSLKCNQYSTWDIAAKDRKEFERVFGRHSDYKASNILAITHGRNVLYSK